jgi:hypothetical protein
MTGMATNTAGAWPIEPSTAIGLFRFEVGDVNGTPHDPTDNLADFEFMSDAVIDALLAAYPDPDAAKARALNSMATQLINAAADIQVDDIKIKTIERANLMLNLSNSFAARAAGTVGDAFGVVPLVSATSYSYPVPQGTPAPFGESGF